MISDRRVFASVRGAHTRKHGASNRARRRSFELLEPRHMMSGDAPRIVGVSIGSSQTGFTYPIPAGPQQLVALPWSQLDQIEISFDKSVVVESDHLLLESILQHEISPAGFQLHASRTKAVWTFESLFRSDHFQISLSDSVTDEEGVPLDGEWWNGHSVQSGDGTAGSMFMYEFKILIGDVDQSGQTSIRDYGLVLSSVGTSTDDSRLDVDTDGILTSADLQWIADSYGELPEQSDPSQSILIASVGDANGDGYPELVSLTQGTRPTLLFVDPQGVAESTSVVLNPSFRFIDVEPIFGASDVAEQVAVLGVHRRTGGIRVWIWDLAASTPTSSIAFNASKIAIDLEVLYNPTADTTELAVLTRLAQSDRTRVYLAGLSDSSASDYVDFGTGFAGFDLEVTAPISGGAPGLAVAGTVSASGGVRVKVKDRTSGNQLGSISYGRVSPVDFEVYQDNAGHDRFALLRTQPSDTHLAVDMRTLSGARTGLLFHATSDVPRDLEVARSDGQTRLAIMTENPLHHENIVIVSNTDGSSKSSTSLGSGFEFTDLAFISMGDREVTSVGQHSSRLGVLQIKSRDLTRKVRLPTVSLTPNEEVPAWFESNRVHGFTRLSMVDPRLGLDRSYHLTAESDLAASLFSELGAQTFSRHAVTMDEDPWWPSELPIDTEGNSVLSMERNNFGIQLGQGENLIQGFINSAWAENLPMMGYYFDISDARIGNLNPQWYCTDSSGGPVSHPFKGKFLDITGPYGNVVLQRLLELADMGLSGIYLDFRHVPVNGCWGSQMAADFMAETGLDAPPVANTPEYVQFALFSARRMQEVISGWKDLLNAEYPHLQLVVSVTTVPGLTRIEMNTDLAAIASPKTEFSIAVRQGMNNSVFRNNPDLYEPPHDVRMALGWTLLREVAEAGLPHVWNAFTPNRDHLFAFLSAVMTYGSVAALDVIEELLLPDGTLPGLASRQDMADGFQLGNQVSPHLSQSDPVKWAAVLFSENARNSHGIDSRAIWEDVNSPTVGAFQAVQRSHRPVSIITDNQLIEGRANAYQVLLLPNPDKLSASQMFAVQQFVAQGGTVIENDPAWDWSSQAGYESAVFALTVMLDSIATKAPVVASGLPDGTHVVSYQKHRVDSDLSATIIAIANRFDFSQASSAFDPIAPENVNPTPPNIPAGATLFLGDNLRFRYAGLAASDLIAMDAVTGQLLPVVRTIGGFEISLPEIERMMLVVVESIALDTDSQFLSSQEDRDTVSRQPTLSRMDVNGDHLITALDALLVINAISHYSRNASGEFDHVRSCCHDGLKKFDVNGDQQVSALDALLIINQLSVRPRVSDEALMQWLPEQKDDDSLAMLAQLSSPLMPLSDQLF